MNSDIAVVGISAEAPGADPPLRTALRSMHHAFEDAGYDAPRLRGSRTGVFVGCDSRPQPRIADRLARFLDLRGPSLSVDGGCSASLMAVQVAKNALLLDDCDTAVVLDAGADALDVRRPTGGPTEAAGAVVLKRIEHALADRDRVYAVIKGGALGRGAGADRATVPLTAAPSEVPSLGLSSLIKTALALRRKEIPPGAQFGATKSHPRPAVVLGAGNCRIVLEAFEAEQPEFESAAEIPRLFTLSARDETALRRLVHEYTEYFADGRFEDAILADLCYTTARSRSSDPCRLALVVTGMRHLRERLDALDTDRIGREPVYATIDAWHRSPVNGFARLARSAGVYGTLHSAAVRYVAQGQLDLSALYQDAGARLVDAPGSAFQEPLRRAALLPAYRPDERAAAVSDPVTHSVEFVLTEAAPVAVSGADGQAEVLALVDPDTDAERMLVEAGFAGARFLRLAAADEPDHERIAAAAATEGFTHAVFALGFEADAVAGVEQLDRRLRKNLYGLFRFAHGLIKAGASLNLVVLTRRALAAVPGEAGVVTENGALIGLGRTISRTYPYVSVACVDVGEQVDPAALGQELLAAEPGVHVLRRGRRYREQFAEVARIASRPGRERYLRRGGTYLITGGTGPIGLEAARLFATREPSVNLVLLSRSGAPAREEWAALAALAAPSGPPAGHPSALAAALLDIEDRGAKIDVIQVDVGEPRELAEAVAAIRQRYGRIDGIVHAAGAGSGAADGDRGDGGVTSRTERAERKDSPLPGRRDRHLAGPVPAARGETAQEQAWQVGRTASYGLSAAVRPAQPGRDQRGVQGTEPRPVNPFPPSEADLSAVIRPKIHAAFVLEALTAADRPDFVAYFSSMAAVFPTPGRTGQAAADYYLANLARARAGTDPRCHLIAYDWVYQEAGTAAASADRHAFEALPFERGVAVFEAGLRSNRHRIFAGRLDYQSEYAQVLPSYPIDLDPAILDKIEQASESRARRRDAAADRVHRQLESVHVRLTGRSDGRYSPAEWLVARCWAQALDDPEIPVDADFFDLGGDSAAAVCLMTTLATCTGVRFSPADLLTERSVAALARTIEHECPVDNP